MADSTSTSRPTNPIIKRYLDAGMAFTQMTQARAEAIVKDLIKTGEVQAAKNEELVRQILERSQRNTDRLMDMVRKEIQSQIAQLGLATRAEVEALEAELADTKAQLARAKQAARKKKAAKKRAAGKKKASKASASKTAAKKRAGAKKAAKKQAGGASA